MCARMNSAKPLKPASEKKLQPDAALPACISSFDLTACKLSSGSTTSRKVPERICTLRIISVCWVVFLGGRDGPGRFEKRLKQAVRLGLNRPGQLKKGVLAPVGRAVRCWEAGKTASLPVAVRLGLFLGPAVRQAAGWRSRSRAQAVRCRGAGTRQPGLAASASSSGTGAWQGRRPGWPRGSDCGGGWQCRSGSAARRPVTQRPGCQS